MGTTPSELNTSTIYPVGQGEKRSGLASRQLRPGLGGPIRVQVWLRRGLLGPAWAALCGALASGELELSNESLLRLALLAFLVDVVWGGLWSALAATDWATPLRQWGSWRRGSPVRFLPYTAPKGPGGRIARSLGQLRSWWSELAGPTLGPTLTGLVLLLPLAIVVAGVLGVRPLLITLVAITLIQFVFVRTGGDMKPVPGAQATFEIMLPWMAGHALFSQLTLPSFFLALAYSLSYAGGLRMVQNQPGLARWNLGQILAVTVLIATHQPLAAGIAGVLFVGQATIQPGLFDIETDQVERGAAIRFLRNIQPWLMATMFVAAWGVWRITT